jgi:hypothetical protein
LSASCKPHSGSAVRPLLACLVGGACLIHGTLWAIQLAPKEIEEKVIEGLPRKHLAFPDPPGFALYEFPERWTWSRSGEGVEFHPPDTDQASLVLQILDASGLPPVDGSRESGEAYKKIALGSVGVREATVQSVNPDLLQIGHSKVCEVVVHYQMRGQRYARTIACFNRGEDQVRLTLTSLERDHAALAGAMRRSLFTWQFVRHLPGE